MLPELDAYARYLVGIRSDATIAQYRGAYSRLSKWLQARGLGVRDLTTDLVDEMREELVISPHTWNLTLHALARPYEEWAKRWDVPYPFLPRHFRQTEPPRPRTGLNLAQYRELYQLASREGEPWPTMVQVMGECGLRLNEACELKRDAVLNTPAHEDLEVPPFYELWLIGKGNKSRRIPISEHLYEAIKSWLAFRKSNYTNDTSKRMFVTPGTDSEGTLTTLPIQPHRLWRRIKRWASQMDAQIQPHDLRRFFITRLAMENVPPLLIQYLAGHSSIRMTSHYVTPSQNDFARIQGIMLADIDILELEEQCNEAQEVVASESTVTASSKTPAPVASIPLVDPTERAKARSGKP